MERYNEYKDSGVQWLGEIPSHWAIMPLKYSGRFCKGKLPSETNENCLGKPIIGASEMNGNMPSVYSEDNSVPQCTKNDILFLWDGANAGLVSFFHEGIVASTVTKFTCDNSNIVSTYLYYLEKNYQRYYKERVGGTTIPHMNSQYIASCPLLIPSTQEQKAIADYLNTTTAKIDEAIVQQQKMIDLLNERKQIIINNAVTKGLNPDAPMKDSGVDWIGEIPEHWEVMPIKRLKSKEKNAFVDGPFGSNLKSEHFVENGDVYVIESGLITTGKYVHRELKTITKSHFDTIKRSECKANDIIIAKIGARFGMAGELPELGKPCVVSGNSLKLTLDQSVMQNGMFVNYMGLAKWKGGFVGLYQETAQPALSLGALNNMMLPVPPIEEQLYILEQTNQKLDILDVAIINASKQISLLQERKQIIINDVVTGKVKVS